MKVKDAISRKLNDALAPSSLSVIDEIGATPWPRGVARGRRNSLQGQRRSAAFAGKSRIERHRMVNALLAEELAGQRPRAGHLGEGPGGALAAALVLGSG